MHLVLVVAVRNIKNVVFNWIFEERKNLLQQIVIDNKSSTGRNACATFVNRKSKDL
jgi:hypothetical protein